MAVGCSEAIVSGPLNREGFAPFHLSILEINDVHPAVVRCHVTCLNQSGAQDYNPAMALIITSQEQFVSVRGPHVSSWDGLYHIVYGNRNSCEAQNNYTMEFEYLIYSRSSKIDRSVVTCGVTLPTPPYMCWGQSYGLIRESAPTTTLTTTHIYKSTNPTTTPQVHYTKPAVSNSIPTPGIGQGSMRYGSDLIHTLICIIVVISILLIITLPMSGAFLYTKSQRRVIAHAPQIECAQRVEQTLMIRLEQQASEKAVKEKETSLNEDSNCSPVQIQLDQKLPDTISSRSTKK